MLSPSEWLRGQQRVIFLSLLAHSKMRRIKADPSTKWKELFSQGKAQLVLHVLVLAASLRWALQHLLPSFFLASLQRGADTLGHRTPDHWGIPYGCCPPDALTPSTLPAEMNADLFSVWEKSRPGPKHFTTRVNLYLQEVIKPRVMSKFCFQRLHHSKEGHMGPADPKTETTVGKKSLRGSCRPGRATQI